LPAAALVIATLHSDRDVITMLPCGFAIAPHAAKEVPDFIADATKDVACALIEYALCAHTLMSVTLTDRVRDFITALNIRGYDASASGVALLETARPHLTTEFVHDLVNSEDLQHLLSKDKGLQSLISGVIRMNKAGRNYVQEEPSNLLQGIFVLDAVVDHTDCMFAHLRENSFFFNR
jgi:hypothetical protein